MKMIDTPSWRSSFEIACFHGSNSDRKIAIAVLIATWAWISSAGAQESLQALFNRYQGAMRACRESYIKHLPYLQVRDLCNVALQVATSISQKFQDPSLEELR